MPLPPLLRARPSPVNRTVILAIALLLLADPARAQELMPPTGGAWSSFAARPETMPAVAATSGSPYALEVYGNGVPNVYGGWRARLAGLSGGQYYRFRGKAIVQDIASPRPSVTILLRWRGSFGDIVAPDYVWEYGVQADGTLVYDKTLQAPSGTTAVDIELILQWSANGRVRFDALSLTPATAPAPRPAKVAAISYRPSGTSSGLDSVQRAELYGEQVAAAERPDVMVFGELLNVIGAPGTYDQKAEPIPGPSTGVMAALARGYSTYVAFGMLERSGSVLYNTAVLLDRSGTIVGKYHKMQLPLSESSAGISPGTDIPVFQTDVGKVALLICQDTAFPEPARQAAILGAEMLLVPIWGGKPAVVGARAIEHSVYVVASGYDYASEIRDPLGTVLARVPAPSQTAVAVATIDLARRFREDWSGVWRDVAGKERRGDYKAVEWTPSTDTPPPPPPPNVPPTVSVTSPSSGASFAAPATVTIAAAAGDSDGSVAQVEFYRGTTLLGSSTTSPYSFKWNNVAAGSYTLTARAIDDGGAATTSAPVSITVTSAPPPLPAPWTSQDIGATGAAGSASASSGTFSIKGAGADIWGNADAFQFVWQPISGDVDVIARVASIQNVAAWVKAGVMIRERLTADSAHALMLVSAGKGLAFQRRLTTGGVSTSASSAGAAPAWVKLERRGNTIAASYSSNGSDWTLAATDTFTMAANVFVGLAVSSHTTSQLATATFDNVTVRAAQAASWQSQDIGAVGVAGGASMSGGTFTLSGGGADVWGTADGFHYAWQPLNGDGNVVARVASVAFIQAWTKAGVMIRERLTADSPHAFMLVSAGRGLAFQRRLTTGGTSSGTNADGAAPAWVKLERRGNVITAFRSADGVAWTIVGSDTFTMGPTVYAGLAVTSHDTSQPAAATFDHVAVP
jgi:predicted amidohydrolase/regulation of enolase protein 1 (concanavalin A-like superfamily)